MTVVSPYIGIYDYKSFCTDCGEFRPKGIRCPECNQRMRNSKRNTKKVATH